MRALDLANVEEAQEFKKVTPGGYICQITNVENVDEKEYLKVEYDIVIGEFKGYYQQLFDSKKFWGGKFIKSYKEAALPFFKGFITSAEKSNDGFIWANDEKKLIGKLVGLILGEEEYVKNDKTVGKRLYVNKVCSVETIKKGVDVPELKRLAGDKKPSDPDWMPSDEKLPWD
jgi:hypothetical protein